MKILQAGLAKSGNFWLYRILQSVTKCSGLEQGGFIQDHPIHELALGWDLSYDEQSDIDVLDIEPLQSYYRISSIFRMPVDDVDAYIQQCSHVWTHSSFCERSSVILPKFDKVVYIVRDPRDRAISASEFAFTPYMKKYYPHDEPEPDTLLANRFNGMMGSWVRHVGGYLKHRDDLQIHVVFYERLLHSFDIELASLLKYLKIELDQASIDQIKHDVDFQTMKDENPDHVRKGKAWRWTQVLTEKQKRQAARIAGPMLRMLNYPVSEDQVGEALPSVPEELDGEEVESTVRHTNRRLLVGKIRRGIRRAYALVT